MHMKVTALLSISRKIYFIKTHNYSKLYSRVNNFSKLHRHLFLQHIYFNKVNNRTSTGIFGENEEDKPQKPNANVLENEIESPDGIKPKKYEFFSSIKTDNTESSAYNDTELKEQLPFNKHGKYITIDSLKRDKYVPRTNIYGKKRSLNEALSLGSHILCETEEADVAKLQAPLKKNFFQPTQQLKSRSSEERQKYLSENSINIKNMENPMPVQAFDDIYLPGKLVEYLSQFAAPTPIQAVGWNIALQGRDFIGIGQTGSGKTLGYALPMLLHVKHQMLELPQSLHSRMPIGLVLAPTRELAQQIEQVFIGLRRYCGVGVAAFFGGNDKRFQLQHLDENKQIYVGTPGRLIDCMSSGEISFKRCSCIVLDEADLMLDMGFEPQISRIIEGTRTDKQTLMWSATWPKEVQHLANEYLVDPAEVNIGNTKIRANPDILQTIHICQEYDKEQMLENLLLEMFSKMDDSQALVFVKTKMAADRVCERLSKKRFNVGVIHGDKSQRSRTLTLNSFRQKRCKVLIATDVAARGLDIQDLPCVVNYDMPQDIESYVHRIGRTGRCGKKGFAHSFFTSNDASVARKLVQVLEDAQQPVNEDLRAMVAQVLVPATSKRAPKRRAFNQHRTKWYDDEEHQHLRSFNKHRTTWYDDEEYNNLQSFRKR